MTRQQHLFTSESVSEGHPDKVCDRISDEIVDAYLAEDPFSRVAVECLATTNRLIIAGEVRGPKISNKNIDDIARKAIKDIGYDQNGFSWQDVIIENYIHEQSSDIAMGVDSSSERDLGAGDQGIMFGYACNETEGLMPAPIYYAHNILKSLSHTRKTNNNAGLGPDAKSQITLEYMDGIPVKANTIVLSTQHVEEMSQQEVRDICLAHISDTLPEGWMCESDKIYINPTGRFVIGGPDGDAGLTGRKIIVDTYGGAAPHGGGAFSGKDPTKVDRSAAYMARYLAKNIVASKIADKCTIQLSYAIGVSKPLSIYVSTQGTSELDDRLLEKLIGENIDLSPAGIRGHLGLNRPIYARTAAYGHFGRTADEDGGFSWERLDLVNFFKSLI